MGSENMALVGLLQIGANDFTVKVAYISKAWPLVIEFLTILPFLEGA